MAQAAAEKQALEIQRIQAETGVRTTATRLTEEQLHEAEAAFRRLAGKPRPLSFYLDYALANYREPDSLKPFAENPIPKVPHYRIRRKRGSAVTFTTAQAAELMEHFETYEGGRWIPYFALCLFAGIRPGVPDGEITKVKPEDVNLETGITAISADASKVREPRRVNIPPNLAAWLRAYPLDKYPIIIGDLKKRREKLRDRFNLTHDVLRHTFISMFVGQFRSIGEAAIQAGNSEAIIRKHYLDMKRPTEAEAFFGIMPQKTEGKGEPRAIAAAA